MTSSRLVDLQITYEASSKDLLYLRKELNTPKDRRILYSSLAANLLNNTLNSRKGLTWVRNNSNTNAVTINTGSIAADDSKFILQYTSSLTKTITSNWAAGNNQGGLDTGTASSSPAWYWIWAIGNDDMEFDFLLSLSNSNPTLPTGYSTKRLIGCIRYSGSAFYDIQSFYNSSGQLLVRYKNPQDLGLSINVSNLSTTRVTYSLTSAIPTFPSAVEFVVIHANVNTDGYIYFSVPDDPDLAPSSSASPLANVSSGTQKLELLCNGSSQICARALTSNTTLRLQILDFIWPVFV